MLSLQSVPSRAAPSGQTPCANAHGISLHAAVRCGANQRKALEHLCRTITRRAIANEQLKLNRAGQVVLQLKNAYKDGTTHIVMSPLEFKQRLAALVPPSPAENASGQPADHVHALASPARLSWARLLKRVFDIDLEHCPQCGGSLKIIAAIVEPSVIARLLAHLGLPTRAPPRSPARRVDLFQAA